MNYFLLEPFPPLWNPLAGAQVNAGPLEDLIDKDLIDKAGLYINNELGIFTRPKNSRDLNYRLGSNHGYYGAPGNMDD